LFILLRKSGVLPEKEELTDLLAEDAKGGK
jgi:hypothetical protein